MAFYTITLQEICEGISGKLKTYDDIIEKALPKIFSFNFPFYDESKRKEFEIMIIKNFYLREIGCETVGEFIIRLDSKLNQIMPYFNKLYAAMDSDFSVLDSDNLSTNRTLNENVDGTNEVNTVENNTSKTTNSGTSNSESVSTRSDTPDGQLDDFLSDSYLSVANKDTGNATAENNSNYTGEGNTNSNQTKNDKRDLTENVIYKGRRGYSAAKLMKDYASAKMKLNEMVCKELEPLFFGLWW